MEFALRTVNSLGQLVCTRGLTFGFLGCRGAGFPHQGKLAPRRSQLRLTEGELFAGGSGSGLEVLPCSANPFLQICVSFGQLCSVRGLNVLQFCAGRAQLVLQHGRTLFLVPQRPEFLAGGFQLAARGNRLGFGQASRLLSLEHLRPGGSKLLLEFADALGLGRHGLSCFGRLLATAADLGAQMFEFCSNGLALLVSRGTSRFQLSSQTLGLLAGLQHRGVPFTNRLIVSLAQAGQVGLSRCRLSSDRLGF